MIPPIELKALEEALDAIETLGVCLICLRCGAELPGSDPAGSLVRLGLCQPCCSQNEALKPGSNSSEDFL